MKIERLYAITLYLLKHGKTPASELAEYFEVSVRTIQRDMDSLNLAGIPITASAGVTGGYEISDRYRLDEQFVTSNDYSCILTALSGLVSATDDPKAKYTLEKIAQKTDSSGNGIVLDFSVLREGDSAMIQALQTAVLKRRVTEFTYTNNNNETRVHRVEPIAVVYRWYAWYLLAYSRFKKDYRMYKVLRMSGLKITEDPFSTEHEAAEVILNRTDATDSRQYTTVLAKCRRDVKTRLAEYLKGTVKAELPNSDFLMELTVVENEQLWLGTLLSLGDSVEILSPEHIRRRVREAAEKIIALYGKL